MSKFYTPEGYFNLPQIKSYGMAFNFVVGGRGTGKTYGGLLDAIQTKTPFFFFRRTDSIVKEILSPQLNPLGPIARDLNFEFITEMLKDGGKASKYVAAWYPAHEEDGRLVKSSDTPLGLAAGLSTFGNVRGLDAYRYDEIIVDEFIPAPNEHTYKGEADSFFNAFETINRNRELQGKKPVQAFLFANAFNLANDYFEELGIIDTCDKMHRNGEMFYINRDKELTVTLLKDSPISAKKKETALYKLTRGTAFQEMALENDFVNDRHTRVKSMPLAEYTPLVKIGELVVYEHKNREEYYACLHLEGTCKEFDISDVEVKRFQHQYLYLWQYYMNDDILFESYTAEVLFRKYFD